MSIILLSKSARIYLKLGTRRFSIVKGLQIWLNQVNTMLFLFPDQRLKSQKNTCSLQVSNLTILNSLDNYKAHLKSVIEMTGPATAIMKYIENLQQVQLQSLNKRFYNIITPEVVFVALIPRLSLPYKEPKGVQNWKYLSSSSDKIVAMWQHPNGDLNPEFQSGKLQIQSKR